MIQASERAKTVHALYRSATVTGSHVFQLTLFSLRCLAMLHQYNYPDIVMSLVALIMKQNVS
jgi:hypothetical protein